MRSNPKSQYSVLICCKRKLFPVSWWTFQELLLWNKGVLLTTSTLLFCLAIFTYYNSTSILCSDCFSYLQFCLSDWWRQICAITSFNANQISSSLQQVRNKMTAGIEIICMQCTSWIQVPFYLRQNNIGFKICLTLLTVALLSQHIFLYYVSSQSYRTIFKDLHSVLVWFAGSILLELQPASKWSYTFDNDHSGPRTFGSCKLGKSRL